MIMSVMLMAKTMIIHQIGEQPGFKVSFVLSFCLEFKTLWSQEGKKIAPSGSLLQPKLAGTPIGHHSSERPLDRVVI